MNQKLRDIYYSTLAVLVNSSILNFEHFPDNSRLLINVQDENLFTFPAYTTEKLAHNVKEFEENYELENDRSSILNKFIYNYCWGNYMNLNNLSIDAKNTESLLLKYTIMLNQNKPEVFKLLIEEINNLDNLLINNINYLNREYPSLKIWDLFFSHPNLPKLFLNNKASYHDEAGTFILNILKLSNDEVESFVTNITSKSTPLEKIALQFLFCDFRNEYISKIIDPQAQSLIYSHKSIHLINTKDGINSFSIDLKELCDLYTPALPLDLLKMIFNVDTLINNSSANVLSNVDNKNYEISFTIMQNNLIVNINTEHLDKQFIKAISLNYIEKYIENALPSAAYKYIKNNDKKNEPYLKPIKPINNISLLQEANNITRENFILSKLNDTNFISRKKPKL